MARQLLLILTLFAVPTSLLAQGVGINNPTPDASALLDLTSTDKGLLVPRMSTVQRDAIPVPATSLLIFNTGNDRFEFYNGSAWVPLVVGGGWLTTGNAGTDPATDFLGTTDNRDLVFRTNGLERMRITNTAFGRVGIRTDTPSSTLEVRSNNGTTTIGEGLTIRNVANGTAPGQLRISHWRGTSASPAALLNNDFLGRIDFLGHNGTGEYIGAIIQSRASENFSTSPIARRTKLQFMTSTNAGAQVLTRMTIDSDGNTGIATEDPQERLHVVGNIRMVDGNQAANKVLTSDADGTGSWQVPKQPDHYVALGTTDHTIGGAFPLPQMTVTFVPKHPVAIVHFSASGPAGSVTCDTPLEFQIVVNGTVVQSVRSGSVDYSTGGFALSNRGYDISFSYPVAVPEGVSTNIQIRARSFNCTVPNNALSAGGPGGAFRSLVVIDPNGTGLTTTTGVPPSSGAWDVIGNATTNPNVNFLGTTDLQSLAFRTANTERMRLSFTGNLGIGTINPLDRLHVVGNIRMVDGNQAAGRLLVSDANGRGTWQDPPQTGWALAGNAGTNPVTAFVGTTDNQALALRTNNLERMRILGNGNVGIGVVAPTSRLHVDGNIRMEDGNQAAGRVMTSNALGVGTWSDIGTLSSGTLDQAYNFGGAGAGRTIVANAGAVTIAGTDGLVSTGTLNTGAIAPAGAGIRMVWNPRKAAFRVGQVNGTQWNDANIGSGSIALGIDNIASGIVSTSIGYDNNVSGEFSMALGNANTISIGLSYALGAGNTVSAVSATAIGTGNTSSNEGSVTLGGSNISSGRLAVAIGEGNLARSRNEVVVGSYSLNYVPISTVTFEPNDRIFVVGNGASATQRSNAMVIRKSGNTGLGNNFPATRLHVNGAVTITPANFTANAQPTLIAPDDRSYLRIGSNSTPANRVVAFENGLAIGQMLVVECTATGSNGIRFASGTNMNVSGIRDLNNQDTITFIWNGTRWLEIGFADN